MAWGEEWVGDWGSGKVEAECVIQSMEGGGKHFHWKHIAIITQEEDIFTLVYA